MALCWLRVLCETMTRRRNLQKPVKIHHLYCFGGISTEVFVAGGKMVGMLSDSGNKRSRWVEQSENTRFPTFYSASLFYSVTVATVCPHSD